MEFTVNRCPWKGDDLMTRYHDTEWGVPLHNDQRWFEFFILDQFQAGLSWSTILRKREAFREVFDGFDPLVVAQYDDQKIQTLLTDARIVRNRAKILAAVHNARIFLDLQAKHGTFDAYIWRFTDGKMKVNAWAELSQIPAVTPEAEAMSADLRQAGFKFTGPTICYAVMQSTGMVNDHLVSCFRYHEVQTL